MSLYTHKGWFGICPVYIARPHSQEPQLAARRPAYEWLFDISAWCFDRWFTLMLRIDPLYDWRFPIVITGELPEPKEMV